MNTDLESITVHILDGYPLFLFSGPSPLVCVGKTIVYTCALSEIPFLSSKKCCGSLFLQLYIFTISVYALALTIRQLFICTEKEWQGEKDFHHTNIFKSLCNHLYFTHTMTVNFVKYFYSLAL